jgi:hypothetical protein
MDSSKHEHAGAFARLAEAQRAMAGASFRRPPTNVVSVDEPKMKAKDGTGTTASKSPGAGRITNCGE